MACPFTATESLTSRLRGDLGWCEKHVASCVQRTQPSVHNFESVVVQMYYTSTGRWHSMLTGRTSQSPMWDGRKGFHTVSSWRVQVDNVGNERRSCFRSCASSGHFEAACMVRNAAALFHHEPWKARAKLDHFRALASRNEIVFAVKCHIKEGDCTGLARSHYEFISVDPYNPRASGGVLTVVRKTFFDTHHCNVRVLHSGRAMAIDLCFPGTALHCCTTAGAHITPTLQHAWSEVAEDVSSQLSKTKWVLLLGDFNFVDDAWDSINFDGEGVGSVGIRANQWSRLFNGYTQ
eukprot:6467919-Amphidinium_carterae.1